VKQPDTSVEERDAKCKKVNLARRRDRARVIDARKQQGEGHAPARRMG
jgi:hypothetical protein